LAAIALSFVTTGFASASTDSLLTLTIAPTGGTPTTMRLTCDPAGGSHPDAKTACEELLTAEGDFDALAGKTTACTMEYRPVVANAIGTWHGHPVLWKGRYANPCTMTSATGTVFRF
jgi:hypothetical protein